MQDTNGVNPYAAPSARIEQHNAYADEQIALASRGRRLGAVILDGLIFGAAFLIAMVPLMMIRDAQGSASKSAVWIVMGIVFLVFGAINLVLLYKHGQTMAKRLLGIRIVRGDGSRASLGRILLLRSIVPGFIGGIPLVGPLFTLTDALFIFADDRRTLHDKMADTIVVDA